ncbi:unnamed protein product [Ectocarpus sp. 12 AP-2014]
MVALESTDILKQLEINFDLALNDLEFASHQLDSRMKDATRADVSIPDLHTLHHRIRAIKTELPGLAKDATEVEAERRETEIALNTTLIENYNVMVGLYARLGVAPDPEWVATAAGVESFLPAPRDSGAVPESFVSGGDKREGVGSAVEEDATQASTVLHSGNAEMSASRVEERVVEQSPSVIFEEDFLAIHANTRGRSKLQDVRKVYAKVREDFEAKKSRGRPGCKPAPITKRELDAAGLKVFGLTGDCVLNTLRAMGLITVHKGSVAMAS